MVRYSVPAFRPSSDQIVCRIICQSPEGVYSNYRRHNSVPNAHSCRWVDMHSTMLSFSLNEAARRGAWTCGSCSTVPRTYQAWFTNSSRSLPVRSRRYSSSKPSSSPKDESRAITTPSTAPAKEALAKERSDQRRVNRRKSKDVGHESGGRGKSKDSSPSNMPSVPSTQNLKAQGLFSTLADANKCLNMTNCYR